MKLNSKMHIPAYPLFVKDPYFSIWTTTDKINESNTIFWHGEEKPIHGYLTVDDKKYVFLGLDDNAIKLPQKGIDLKALSTSYTFKCDDFIFVVEFISPLTLKDLNVLSMPVCYMNYEFKSENRHDIKVELVVDQSIAYNTSYINEKKECRGNRFVLDQFEVACVGLERQMPLSHANDEDGADWGIYYLTGHKAEVVSNDGLSIRASYEYKDVNLSNETFMLAYDDIVSIYYFGEFLRGYYFEKNNKTIFDALKEAYNQRIIIKNKCLKEEKLIDKYSKKYGKEYQLIVNAAYRQTIGGHKLVMNKKNELLFLSKECNSDGCIGTVDISYPSMPLFLLMNPKLVEGMLTPIFTFANMPIWKFDYAPHDVGIYPYCIGQYYAVKSTKEEQLDIEVHNWRKETVLPFYYQFPSNTPIFDENRQMPVEESGNLLLMTYLLAKKTNNTKIINNNIQLLSKWVNYLVDYGLEPANQLCTDDFAGHLGGNANLSIKAILGIHAYANISKMIGNHDEYNKYREIAKDYASKWTNKYKDGDHYVLALGQKGTYSLKYNMALDALFDEQLFSSEIKENEVNYYLTKKNKYGVPLDTRADYTKTDWMVWSSCLTKDMNKQKEMIHCIYAFLCESKDHVPFSDWVYTSEAKYQIFRNRTVQGGLYLPILIDMWK